jgi:NADH:ubiquinone reductase (H+-translocating)
MRIRHPAALKNQKIVVIIGGGFAGLNTALSLANQSEVFVVLIDQRNYHLFQPLLYQVATAGLNPSDIAVPIRSQFADASNVEVHLDRVEHVHLSEKYVSSGGHEFEFDYLILACGAQHSYFSHPEWEELAPGLKTLEQATEIRRRILFAFEEAENELDPKRQEALLTFVIVGGGPTGVELAGAIADISRTVLVKDFKRINPASARVILIEAGSKILSTFDETLSQRAQNDLQNLGVEVITQTRVDKITVDGVAHGEKFIFAKNAFWAAGVQANKIQTTPGLDMDRAGRIKVPLTLALPEFPYVYVIGDMASVEVGPQRMLPGLAPVAIQAGKYVGERILAELRKKDFPVFHYVDKGQMATIGKNKAIAQSGGLKMTGRLAWFAWLFVHVFFMIGFKNRISVMSEWAWAYLFSKRGSRLITEKNWKLKN